jgi:CubicO group peptidase (beta-lactamase class C family)
VSLRGTFRWHPTVPVTRHPMVRALGAHRPVASDLASDGADPPRMGRTTRLVRALGASATVALLTIAAVACTSDHRSDDPAASSAGPGEAAASSDGDCDPELGDALAAWGEAGFSGAVAVLGGGEPECLGAYGLADQEDERPNTVDTVFDVGSVTKAFTAAAVLDLVDQGALGLDTRAGDLVDGLSGPAADATVEHLLLHTSGLAGSHGTDDVPLTRDEAVASLSGLELAFEPGTDYLYSNAGYTVLALVVEEAAGTSYRDEVRSALLSPRTGDVPAGFWYGEPAAPEPRAVGYLEDGSVGDLGDEPAVGEAPWATEGNGGLAMAVPDLARWAGALFGGELVPAGATEALTTLRFDHGDGTAEAPGWVAFDDTRFGEPAYAAAGAGGTGHNVVVAVLPESDRVVAMASNTAELTAEDLLATVGPALVAGDPLPRPQSADDAEATDPEAVAAADAAAGTYELDGGGRFEVTAGGDDGDDGDGGDGGDGGDDGRLSVAADGAAAVAALFPPADGDTAGDLATHEEAVLALLAGETEEGRREREAVENDFGPIDDVTAVGTIVRDGELRTYVTITSGSEALLFWYALDDAGVVAAVEGDTEPPSLDLVPADAGSYRPDDPTGRGPDLTVAFADDTMTVTGPAGSASARRAG